jgi:hypothetical protein
MNKSERETAFLGQVLSYDDTAESRSLKASITQAEQAERCVLRALRLPVLLLVVAAVGLGYCKMLLDGNAANITWSAEQSIANGFYGAGLGSLFSGLVLLGLVALYHKRTSERRAEGRRFAAKLLETRLGKPMPLTPPGGSAPSRIASITDLRPTGVRDYAASL